MNSGKQALEDSFAFRPFKDLKKIIESRAAGAPSGPVHDKRKEEHISDEELFSRAMREVREIREFRELPVRRKEATPAHRCAAPGNEAIKTLEGIVEGRSPVNLPDTQEYVEWVRPEYRQDSRSSIIRKLHKGRFAVQESLDLHGLIVEEAEAEVERFLREAFRKRLRCVKIIHGRGLRSSNGPVLKDALISWLSGRFRKQLIAFVTARQCDGGLGALYILLQ